MKKRVACLLVFLVSALILLSFMSVKVLAQDTENTTDSDSDSTTSVSATDETSKISKAYSCLEDKVDGNCNSLSIEEQAFSLLALASSSGVQGECKSSLLAKSKNSGECWPSSSCRLRDTSLAVLALENLNSDTTKAESWLLAQKKIPTELVWYLEIDSNEETKCTISDGASDKTITIKADKKISGTTGTCLSIAAGNYFLKIKDTCYEKTFTVSCDKGFVSTLLYQKGTTYHVSSETKSAPAEGTTQHQVNAFCLKQGAVCDYEGTLWATLALAKAGKDVSAFLPYLIALADEPENEKYFPSAFLYMITDYDDYFTLIVDEFKSSGYWEITNSPYHKFYDTALALVSLYGVDVEQAQEAKNYLLEVQGSDGCWRDNIAETAFILYAAWPKSPSVIDGGEVDVCEDFQHTCTSPLECAQSDLLNNFWCSGGDVCCSKSPIELTCIEKQGIICSASQVCQGNTIPASDPGSCCSGSCIVQEETECVTESFSCSPSDCLDDEEEKAYDCSAGEICCGAKATPTGSWWWLIILLSILIILVVLAIIFRNQLKIWWFRIKSKFKKGPAPTRTTRPGFPPGFPPGARPGMMRTAAGPRMILPFQQRPPQRQQGPVRRMISKTDQELEETLKKLKEMSK